jgi:hypothetical protein
MNLLKTKFSTLNFRLCVVFSAILLSVLAMPALALADTVPEKACEANHYILNKDKTPTSNMAACVAGYNGSKAQKTLDIICGSYSGDNKDACTFGYGKGACSIDDPNQNNIDKCLNANPIVTTLNLVINFLSAGVGIVIVGSIIYGGIQYSWAGNNANQVAAAKDRIQNALVALIVFFFIFAFLNYLIPGGLLFQ